MSTDVDFDERYVVASKADIHHLMRAVTAAVVVGATIMLMFLGALHSPEPNSVEVALVGPREMTSSVAEHIDAQAPGAFDFEYVDDEQEARDDVLEQEVTAAFAPDPETSHLIIAGASGALSQNALTAIFRAASEGVGGTLEVEDVAPLDSGDRAGLSPFLITVATLLPSIVLAILIALVFGRTASAHARLATAAVGSGLLALTGALVADPILGALTGTFWALFGALWLLSFAVTGVALALHRILGIAGLGLAFLVLLVAGMPTAGGAVGPNFIPDGYQLFSLVTPAGEAVPLVRKLVYFDQASVGRELALLATWGAAAALVLLLPARRTHPSQQAELSSAAAADN
jgi:hypothetical protein